MLKKCLILPVLIVALLLSVLASAADDVFVLQTGELAIDGTSVHYSQHLFTVSQPGFAVLRVTKLTPGMAIEGGYLFLNHRKIPLKHFFTIEDTIFERKVRLVENNALNVYLNGSPGAAVAIDIRMETGTNPPPVIAFEAVPFTITAGDAATLTWATENADSVVIDNNIGPVDLSGSVSVTPAQTTTYTLTAEGPGGTSTAQVTVTVTNLPPEVEISAYPDTITAGESAVLTWSSAGVDSCVIEPDIGLVSLSGSLTVSPVQTTTYTIIATGQWGETSAEAVVTVTNPAPTVEIFSSPQTIAIGESATLSWTSENATTCSIEPLIGPVDTIGSTIVSPAETTTYTITAIGPGGSATAQVSVAVQYPIPVISFSASPSAILPGQTATLSWATTHTDSVEIDQDIGAVSTSGTVTVTPAQTITYTLTATGPGGTATAQVTVTVVNPIPTVDLQIEPTVITMGQTAMLSWTSVNAVSLTIDKGIGEVAPSGTLSVSPEETTTYTITATGPGGVADAQATVTVEQPPITLSITSPWPGDLVVRPDVLVTGTFTNYAGLETGITVNGTVAMTSGNRFAANHVPLVSGDNTITIRAMDTAGNTAEASISVTVDISGQYIRISLEPPSGLAPLETAVTITGSMNLEVMNFSINVDGPPDAVVSEPTPTDYTLALGTPGFYKVSVQAVDAQNNVYSDTGALQALDQTVVDALLQSKWQDMKAGLASGDVAGAVALFSEATKAKYETILTLLQAHLSDVAAGLQDAALINADDTQAEYNLIGVQDGQAYSFYLLFEKDCDGIWRIKFF